MILPITKATIRNQRFLVRVDWNVATESDGTISDDFRLLASFPTICHLLKRQAKQIILVSHFGNPVVRPGEDFQRTVAGNSRLTMKEVARHAQKLLRLEKSTLKQVQLSGSPLPGYALDPRLILLENVRFHSGELSNDFNFGRALATLADSFVNEAFSESHRTVASLVQPAKLLPSYAGLQLIREIETLKQLTNEPPKPTVMVLGGAKVHDKVMLIDTLLKKVDTFLLGGVMANTFLAALGVDVRRSLVEHDRLPVVRNLLNRAPQKFILPIDFIWERDRALDIGSQTTVLFTRYLDKAKLIFWNGPMGWTSSGRERFAHGSETIAQKMAASAATTIVAGGDTLALIDDLKLAKDFTFRSTGGGATLTYLAGDEMPGLTALESRNSK
jgi:3-phosphoglycerate kinase